MAVYQARKQGKFVEPTDNKNSMNKVYSILRIPHPHPGKSSLIPLWTPAQKTAFDSWNKKVHGLK
jgi:hypothetical protein